MGVQLEKLEQKEKQDVEMRAFTAHRNKPPKRPLRYSESLPQEDKILLAPDLKLTIPGTNGLGAVLKLGV